ncbi:MAG: nicotinamide mononucleotide transporter [Planctomycetes bacterium]|nr:nicotinamide mononucleotide transporter [Planctomycetota bacterium]
MTDCLLSNWAAWLPLSPLEIVATAFGLWSVWCYVREHLWSWPTGLINVLLQLVLFWKAGLYAESGLQVVYVFLQCYGWWQWLRGGERHQGVVIARTTPRAWLVLTSLGIASYVPLAMALDCWTDSTVPWADSAPVVLCLVAQWMISHKRLENWLVWIAANLLSIPLFASKELYLIAGLNVVFLGLSVWGYVRWRRAFSASNATMPGASSRYRRGMVLGKFMPPTSGHEYLARFGRGCCQRLSVLVCSKPGEPIPGHCRAAWVREMLPDCDVVHVPDDLPGAPEEHPDFWDRWLPVIRRAVGEPIDVVFTSEPYGDELALRLGARHLVADRGRQGVPVSGTAMRADPYAHWIHLPAAVRPWYCRRVVVFGPESTGKTTLAARLAQHFATVWAPEWARGHLDAKRGVADAADFPLIALGQAASEDALARQANRVLICDTDTLTTTIWSDVYLGTCEPWITELARRRRHDLYLLLDIDVPWVDDQQRDMPHRREEFAARCRAALEADGRPYVVVSGDWDARFATAVAAIDRLLVPLADAPPIAAQERLTGELARSNA